MSLLHDDSQICHSQEVLYSISHLPFNLIPLVELCDIGYYKITIGVFGDRYQINAYFAFNGLFCR